MKYTSMLNVCALMALLLATACSNNATSHGDAVLEVQHADSLPQTVKKLVKAIDKSDTVAFAKLVSYPLLRPYPLHDIDSEPAMESYYPVLVDDSLHRVITTAGPQQWHELGWRGWSVYDGQYLWVDEESVYSVNYVSGRERSMLDSLSEAEIASLAPRLRQGSWSPVGCMKAVDGTAVYRIDLAKGAHKGPAYRMAEYASTTDMRSMPVRLFTGYMETEGSAMIASYHFTAPDGTRAEYTPEAPDGSSMIELTLPDGSVKEVIVEPAYWLDLLPKQ